MPSLQSPRLRVGFLLSPRFTLSAFANFVDVLRLAADESDRSRPINCRWNVLAAQLRPIRSSCGISVQPEQRLGEPDRFDYIVVVGGLLDELVELDSEYTGFLKKAVERKIPLVGVCTGAFTLHHAGLMDGYRCCVSWFHHDDFLERFDGLRPVSDQIFVVDRDRLTCSGGASSAHLAAFLVDRHLGRSAALKSLHIMIIDEPNSAEMLQPGLPMELTTQDPLVRKALIRMQQTVSTPVGINELAAEFGVSRRKLERHFDRSVGVAPSAAALKIRLAHVRSFLARGERSITSIAMATGFCDMSHLVKVFRRHEGVTPSAYRTQMGILPK